MAVHLDCTGGFAAKSYASRLDNTEGYRVCDWVLGKCQDLGWRPNHIHEWECAGMSHKCPRLLRDIKAYPFWALYQQEQEKADAAEKAELEAKDKSEARTDEDLATPVKKQWRSGRGTFLLFLQHITIEMRNKTCLSYFYCRLVKCFADHDVMLDQLMKVVIAGAKEWKETCPSAPAPKFPHSFDLEGIKVKRREAKEVFAFAKHHLTAHLEVGKHDSCAHHCVQHALGDCDEKHDDVCDECGKLHRFGENLARYHQQWCNNLCRAYENELPSFRKGTRTVRATENTIPSYKGRKVKKDFGSHGIFFGIVQHSQINAKTGKLMYHVQYGDGDREDLDALELDPLLVPEENLIDLEDDGDVDVPAGIFRRNLMDLVRLSKHHRHAPESWCAHQARGKHQGHHMTEELPSTVLGKRKRESLPSDARASKKHKPIPITFDIDMRAKTLPSKHNSAQGFPHPKTHSHVCFRPCPPIFPFPLPSEAMGVSPLVSALFSFFIRPRACKTFVFASF